MNALNYLCIFSGVILFVSLLPKNSNFLDIRSIFVGHFNIFKNNPLQLCSVFIIPIVFSIKIAQIRCITGEVLNNLNIVLTILITMMFSVLSILCTLCESTEKKEYQKLLNETFISTIFEAVMCLLLLFISFVTLFIGRYEETKGIEIISGIIYYLTMVVILNILIVIKRIKVLFEKRQ